MTPSDSDMQIVLEQVPRDDFNEESYVHVLGIQEIENMTEEERRANTRTLDELLKDLEDDEPKV